MKEAIKVLILGLAAIAAIVATGLIAGYSMFAWIVAYWIVLLLKNLLDYVNWRSAHENSKD